MLIVNADDLGRDTLATDNILKCHARGQLTSTSAMVYMADSERAAAQALASGIDVGLHINLSERLSSTGVPARLRECHEQICSFLSANRYALLLYHPLLRKQFQYVFEMQHAEFLRLYGRSPSHFDGHQHKHLASNMLMQHILPEGTKVRRSFSFVAGEKSKMNRWYRSRVDRHLLRRHRLTDYFFALSQHQTPDRFGKMIGFAQTANVELMTHPAIQAEFDFLNSNYYHDCIARIQLGTYADL